MIEMLVSLIVTLLIAGLLYWAVITILGVIPLPEPIKTVVHVLLVVVICIMCIYALMSFLPVGRLGLR